MKNQSSFNVYRQIKKSAIKTLISAGVNVRDAFKMLQSSMPYMFLGKEASDKYDNENQF